MDLFKNQKQFVDDIKEGVMLSLRDSINTFRTEFKEYVTEKQLYDLGIDGNGQKLPLYSNPYARYKISKGQPVDRKTLRDTGRYHDSIVVDAYNEYYEIRSDVSYAKWQVYHYGKQVWEITKENMEDFFEKYYIPKFREYVKSRLSE